MKRFSTPTFFALLLLAVLPLDGMAQVTGISYTAAPVGLRTFYGDDAGLSDSWSYGGALGLGFGEYLEVAGEYLMSYDTKTDFSDFGSDQAIQGALEALDTRDVDVTRYGGRLRLNIGRTGLLPFVTAGAGIIEFKPDDAGKTESIYLDAGAGLTFSVADRYTLTVSASRMGYRYSPFATFGLGNPLVTGGQPFDEDDFPIRTVYNTNVRAALMLYLGGRGRGEMSDIDRAIADQLGGGVPRIYAQPFYGRIDFNQKLGNFPSQQPVSGVNAGIDLGPYVGLRGFYWRATDEDELFDKSPIEFRDMQFYGGELNLRFASSGLGSSLTPYLVVGGGYMNVDDGYEAEDVFAAPDSRFFATGGAGIDVPLSSNFRLNAGLRSLLMSDQELDDVATPSSVYNSWMYTAGVEFSFGGGNSARDVAAAERERRLRAMTSAEQEIERLREQRASLRSELDSTSTAYENASDEERAEIERLQSEIESLRQRASQRDTVYIERDGRVQGVPQSRLTPQEQQRLERAERIERQMADEQMMRTSTNNLSGQTLALPVPNVGEIYVRFGDTVGETTVDTYATPVVVTQSGTPMATQQGAPQGTAMQGTVAQMTPAQIQQIVRETIQSEMARSDSQQVTQAEIQQAVSSAVQQQLQQLAQSDARMADLEAAQRMEVRLAEIEARLDRRLNAIETRQVVSTADQPNVTVVDGANAGTTRIVTTDSGVLGRQFTNAFPYLGFRTGNGTNQFLFGVRAEFTRPTNTGFKFVPEAAFGFGDGTSFQVFGNAVFPFASDDYVRDLYPYAGVGLGFISREGLKGLDLGLNLMLGADYRFGPGAVMIEYSAPNFFDYNRILLGYKLNF